MSELMTIGFSPLGSAATVVFRHQISHIGPMKTTVARASNEIEVGENGKMLIFGLIVVSWKQ